MSQELELWWRGLWSVWSLKKSSFILSHFGTWSWKHSCVSFFCHHSLWSVPNCVQFVNEFLLSCFIIQKCREGNSSFYFLKRYWLRRNKLCSSSTSVNLLILHNIELPKDMLWSSLSPGFNNVCFGLTQRRVIDSHAIPIYPISYLI